MRTRILTNGEKVIIDASGYSNDRCLLDLQKLVEALEKYGISVEIEKIEKKPEAYVKSEAKVNV